MENKQTAQACKICGANNNGTLYRVKEMMYGSRDEFLYFQCSQCECLQIKEIPANISAYYPQQYYSFKPYDGEKFKGIRGKIKTFIYQTSLIHNSFLRIIVRTLFPTYHFDALDDLALTRETRILDVGCGNGDKYLYPLAEMKFKLILGCDPFIADLITYSNGLQIRKTDIFGIEGDWDIIIYHHAFEHVSNPLENLQQVEKRLAPGGVCIISVPTVSSYAWKHFGTNWYQLDAPRHFFLHSRKSMDYLAKKSGLMLSRIVSDSDYKQFVISERYSNGIAMVAPVEKGILPYLRRKAMKLKYNRMARKLNRNGEGDIATFYLTKQQKY